MPTSWRRLAGLTAFFGVVTLITQARFMGDTVDYVVLAQRFDRHGWEFGHLWWVPLGWIVSQMAQALSSSLTPTDLRFLLLGFYIGINLFSGLACVLLMYVLACRLDVKPPVAMAAAGVCLFAQAFLNFTQTGSSYIPGLACVLLALCLAVRAGTRAALYAAGAALGAAVCFWFPYVLVIPGVLAAPLILTGKERWRDVARMAVGLIVLLSVAYGIALLSLGITDVAGFRAWMAEASHGVKTRGLARAVFGLARACIFMGEDGLWFKRYLLRDPYNPVSLGDLVRLSLWKFVLFYLTLLALFVGLARTARGRRLLLFAAIGAVPVFVFGVFWQGGDMERYLPLFPFLFLAVAGLWSQTEARMERALVAGFFVLLVLVNGLALSRWQVSRYRRDLTQRIEPLREHLTPNSQVIVVRDRLKLLPRDFPFASSGRGLSVVETAVPGLEETPNWRRDFALVVRRTWEADGDVWLSQRLTARRPPPDSTWVEGDDPRLSWQEVRDFFLGLETTDAVGGEDGFVKLTRSPANERVLAELTQGK